MPIAAFEVEGAISVLTPKPFALIGDAEGGRTGRVGTGVKYAPKPVRGADCLGPTGLDCTGVK
jgi:hypothetical protein